MDLQHLLQLRDGLGREGGVLPVGVVVALDGGNGVPLLQGRVSQIDLEGGGGLVVPDPESLGPEGVHLLELLRQKKGRGEAEADLHVFGRGLQRRPVPGQDGRQEVGVQGLDLLHLRRGGAVFLPAQVESRQDVADLGGLGVPGEEDLEALLDLRASAPAPAWPRPGKRSRPRRPRRRPGPRLPGRTGPPAEGRIGRRARGRSGARPGPLPSKIGTRRKGHAAPRRRGPDRPSAHPPGPGRRPSRARRPPGPPPGRFAARRGKARWRGLPGPGPPLRPPPGDPGGPGGGSGPQRGSAPPAGGRSSPGNGRSGRRRPRCSAPEGRGAWGPGSGHPPGKGPAPARSAPLPYRRGRP